MLRLVLAIVAIANFTTAYQFFFAPESIAMFVDLQPLDSLHRLFAMTIGALLSVFGIGGLLPLFRPLKYGSIIIMLLLMHFMIFIVDVIVLARDEMPWTVIVPEMIYFLLVSAALIRWYPIRVKPNDQTTVITNAEYKTE